MFQGQKLWLSFWPHFTTWWKMNNELRQFCKWKGVCLACGEALNTILSIDAHFWWLSQLQIVLLWLFRFLRKSQENPSKQKSKLFHFGILGEKNQNYFEVFRFFIFFCGIYGFCDGFERQDFCFVWRLPEVVQKRFIASKRILSFLERRIPNSFLVCSRVDHHFPQV